MRHSRAVVITVNGPSLQFTEPIARGSAISRPSTSKATSQASTIQPLRHIAGGHLLADWAMVMAIEEYPELAVSSRMHLYGTSVVLINRLGPIESTKQAL